MYNHCFVLANKYQHADFPKASDIKRIHAENNEDFEGGENKVIEMTEVKNDAQTPSKMLEKTDMRANESSPKASEGADAPPHKANLGALCVFTAVIGMGNIQAGFVISGNN